MEQLDNTQGLFLLRLKEMDIYLQEGWKELSDAGISKMLDKRKILI